MKDSIRAKAKREMARDLFAELSEDMKALAALQFKVVVSKISAAKVSYSARITAKKARDPAFPSARLSCTNQCASQSGAVRV
jgi:hypothetical protein